MAGANAHIQDKVAWICFVLCLLKDNPYFEVTNQILLPGLKYFLK